MVKVKVKNITDTFFIRIMQMKIKNIVLTAWALVHIQLVLVTYPFALAGKEE